MWGRYYGEGAPKGGFDVGVEVVAGEKSGELMFFSFLFLLFRGREARDRDGSWVRGWEKGTHAW